MRLRWPAGQTKTLAEMDPGDPSDSQEAAMRACIDGRRFQVDDQDPSTWRVEGRRGDLYDVQVVYMPGAEPAVTCSCPHGCHRGGEARCWHALMVLRLLRAAARKRAGRAEAEAEAPAAEDAAPAAAGDGYQLFTSSYRKFRQSMGVPVKISNGRPKFGRSYVLRYQVPILYPNWSWMKLPVAEFRARYWEQLDGYGLGQIEDVFRRIVAENERRTAVRDDRLVLLCFEKDPVDCHRGDFAIWYERVTGVPVADLPEGVLPL